MQGELARAAAILARGGLVGMPTETVYGLAADADRRDAVAAIFAAKGRPADHPLIVHVPGIEAASSWAREVPAPALALMQAFWPGPLTLVLPRSARAHDLLTGGQDSVGLRAPAHPVARALLQALAQVRGDPGVAIAAPSANRFGRISPTSARHVRDDLGEGAGSAVEMILDGGSSERGIESTIVQCLPDGVRILRPGSIGARALAAVTGLPVHGAGSDAEGPRASGRLESHYAPRRPLELVRPGGLPGRIADLGNVPLAVLVPARGAPDLPAGVLRFEAPYDDAPAFARVLYERLRSMDQGAVGRILVVEPPGGEDWIAVHDRLARAAAGRPAK